MQHTKTFPLLMVYWEIVHQLHSGKVNTNKDVVPSTCIVATSTSTTISTRIT